MIEGTTASGFHYEFEEETIDDMEFVEMLAKSDSDFTILPDILNWIFGEEQKKAFYQHLKEKYGRASLKVTSDALREIFENAGETVKNLLDSPE